MTLAVVNHDSRPSGGPQIQNSAGMRFLVLTVLSLAGVVTLFKSEKMFVLPFLVDPSSSLESNRSSGIRRNVTLSYLDQNEADSSHPKVAWLMTYPNSGTTYTLKLIQQYTNMTTGTNYGYEQSTTRNSIPIAEHLENGPFWRYPNIDRPKDFILTKTHCGGNCMCAKPEEYVETPRSFEIACRSGSRTVANESRIDTTYPASIPKRAVHLFRNPFDNLVARLHLEQKKWARKNETEFIKFFTPTKLGFSRWCRFLELKANRSEFSSHFYDDDMLNIAKSLPCHAEIVRYTWWHDLALETVRRMELPLYNLYYENYTDNWQTTVNELFEFLHLTPAEGAQPTEFIAGKHYIDYFDAEHVSLAKDLVQMLASKELWRLIRHYF